MNYTDKEIAAIEKSIQKEKKTRNRTQINYPVVLDSDETEYPENILDLVGYANMFLGEGRYVDLEEVVGEIARDAVGFVRTGILASIVRRYRLYKDKFARFQDWCEQGLKRTHWHIKRTIEAARVVLDLIREGFTQLPTCEAQCRPLAKFFGDELGEKWAAVIHSVPAHQITAAKIEEIVSGPKPKKRKISVDPDIYEAISRRALEDGMSVEELLRDTFGDGEETSEPEPEAIERWEEELEELAEEHDEIEQQLIEKLQSEFDRAIDFMNRLTTAISPPPSRKAWGNSS